jgi:hypothetical protein
MNFPRALSHMQITRIASTTTPTATSSGTNHTGSDSTEFIASSAAERTFTFASAGLKLKKFPPPPPSSARNGGEANDEPLRDVERLKQNPFRQLKCGAERLEDLNLPRVRIHAALQRRTDALSSSTPLRDFMKRSALSVCAKPRSRKPEVCWCAIYVGRSALKSNLTHHIPE